MIIIFSLYAEFRLDQQNVKYINIFSRILIDLQNYIHYIQNRYGKRTINISPVYIIFHDSDWTRWETLQIFKLKFCHFDQSLKF